MNSTPALCRAQPSAKPALRHCERPHDLPHVERGQFRFERAKRANCSHGAPDFFIAVDRRRFGRRTHLRDDVCGHCFGYSWDALLFSLPLL